MEDFIDELTRQLECGFDGMRFNRDWVYEIINDALAKTDVRLTPLETDAAINNQNEGQAVAAAPLKHGR